MEELSSRNPRTSLNHLPQLEESRLPLPGDCAKASRDICIPQDFPAFALLTPDNNKDEVSAQSEKHSSFSRDKNCTHQRHCRTWLIYTSRNQGSHERTGHKVIWGGVGWKWVGKSRTESWMGEDLLT